jgi:hypothetical protein
MGVIKSADFCPPLLLERGFALRAKQIVSVYLEGKSHFKSHPTQIVPLTKANS